LSSTESYTLGRLAELTGAELKGDSECLISGIGSLAAAAENQVSFLSDPSYLELLATTTAGAVVLTESNQGAFSGNVLISPNPYLVFARLTEIFDDRPRLRIGAHPSAVVATNAEIDPTASIGPNAVIGDQVHLEANVEIGAGSVIGNKVVIGEGSRIAANVTICHGVTLAQNVIIHSGAVIGGDGFGFANDRGSWVKIAQLGSVVIGNDVEVGANTTIDRGALENTVIEEGVKIDNQVMVAHNVHIGANTAIAGCVGISGSTKIGRQCTLAGGVGLVGHITLADNVHITGMTMVTKSILEAGSYSSGTAMMPTREWKKNSVRMKQLEKLSKRVAQLEKLIKQAKP